MLSSELEMNMFDSVNFMTVVH